MHSNILDFFSTFYAAAGLGLVIGYLLKTIRDLFQLNLKSVKSQALKGNPEDKLTVYSFPRGFKDVISSASTGCGKLVTFMKLSEVEHRVSWKVNLMKAPRGKAPFIKHGDQFISDSAAIIDYVIATYAKPGATHLGKVRIQLTADEKARSVLISSTLENQIYNTLVHKRWFSEGDEFKALKTAFFSDLPVILRSLIVRMVRTDMAKWIWGCGVSRYSDLELAQQFKDIYDAIEHELGRTAGSFVNGEDITVVDTVLFTFTDNIVNGPFKLLGMKEYVLNLKNVMNQYKAMVEEYKSK